LRLLLPIRPDHVENILRGTKQYEFRRVRARRPVELIVIYSTAPVSMIVGEAEVTGIVDGSLEEVWRQTADVAGISRESFDIYYRGRNKAFAYRLGAVRKYRRPKRLAELGLASAPQSFVYLPA